MRSAGKTRRRSLRSAVRRPPNLRAPLCAWSSGPLHRERLLSWPLGVQPVASNRSTSSSRALKPPGPTKPPASARPPPTAAGRPGVPSQTRATSRGRACSEPDRDRHAYQSGRSIEEMERIRGARSAYQQGDPDQSCCRDENEDGQHSPVDAETVVRAAARAPSGDRRPDRHPDDPGRRSDGRPPKELVKCRHATHGSAPMTRVTALRGWTSRLDQDERDLSGARAPGIVLAGHPTARRNSP